MQSAKPANAILEIFNINSRKSTWSFYEVKTTCSAAGFAVVDRRGNVTRIDQRTTGDLWEEIAPSPVSARSVGGSNHVQADHRSQRISPILEWSGRRRGGCYAAPYPSGAAITGRLDYAGAFRRRPSLRGANAPHGGFE
jgi:hypothetical protein